HERWGCRGDRYRLLWGDETGGIGCRCTVGRHPPGDDEAMGVIDVVGKSPSNEFRIEASSRDRRSLRARAGLLRRGLLGGGLLRAGLLRGGLLGGGLLRGRLLRAGLLGGRLLRAGLLGGGLLRAGLLRGGLLGGGLLRGRLLRAGLLGRRWSLSFVVRHHTDPLGGPPGDITSAVGEILDGRAE